jgi:gliding motility-associated-like protein
LGYSGDGGPATSARLTTVAGICLDNAGNIYIADPGAHVIRKIGSCNLASISVQPNNQSVCEGGSTAFTTTATDVTNYQWQVNDGLGWSNVNDNAVYSGSASDNLSIIGPNLIMDGYQYRCVITNGCGNVNSSFVDLTVSTTSAPTITITTPTDNICAGANTIFTAIPVNAGSSPSYQWKKNNISIGTNNAVFNDINFSTGDIISCVLTSTNACSATNTATSNTISLSVNPLLTPTVNILPSQNDICFGTSVTFSSSVINGGPSPSLQWKKNNINVGDNSATYTDNLLNDGDMITCVLTSNQHCLAPASVGSNTLLMNVKPLVHPSVTVNTINNTVCPGAIVTYTAVSIGGGPSPVYQWKKNGIPVGVNSATYTEHNVLDGDIINCTVTSNNDCLAVSSVNSNSIVMRLLKNPVVSLDKTSFLCVGTSRVLDAGTFNAYRWSDGSSGRTLSISSTGDYYVTVTDNNGCIGSDTTTVSNLQPGPGNFLPRDTSICNYGDLTLIPKIRYKSYSWSNSSTTANLTIKQPGLYWLEVKDDNNCIGKDTITVLPKQCITGFYMPNGFTPNSDGKNDVFKPLIFGDVNTYRFTIYNRWGQIVFESTQLNKGWDGTLKGKQNGNVFIWTCGYQLEGGKQELKKGTVVLVK